MARRSATTTVHLMQSFHYDVAYQRTFKGYLPLSLNIIREGLKLLRKHRDFTFNIEQVVLLREYWKKHPEDRAALRKHAKEGRLVIAPGMFTMPDTNIPSGESFIRNALIGRGWLAENLGIEPECCWMADIFGHAPQSPQLANTCGYRMFMFERGKSGTWDATFFWKGLDGSTIPTQWEVDSYCGMQMTLGFPGRPFDWLVQRTREQTIGMLQKHSPDAGLVMTKLGGDFRLPEPKDIDFFRAWNRKVRDIQFVYSTPTNYLDALLARKTKLKTLSEDMNPLCEGCFSMRIRIKQKNRKLEETAATLEMLECLTGKPHRASEMLWEVLSFNAFHDIICGSLVKEAAVE
ncbi:MAG: hypothetical protein IT440_04920, partial [Phycisphaeraceae bacterium]|nr:hypothetical protein [Phycisphaeraceae bacterium]